MPHRPPQPTVPLNPALTQIGLSQGQGSIPPLPGGFAPGQVGQFSGGGFVDVDLSPDARAQSGRKGKRARRIFANRVQSGETLADAAGIDVTPQVRGGIEQLVQSGANRTAIAGLLDVFQERQDVEKGRLESVERGFAAIQEASGVSDLGLRTAATTNPQLQALVQAAGDGGVAGQQAIKTVRALSPEGQRLTGIATDTLEQGLKNAEQAGFNSMLDREGRLNDRFRKAFDTSAEVITSAEQILGALELDDPLAVLTAIIKFAKAADPDSVVREGEVTTVTGGTGLAQFLMTEFNKAVGSGFTENAKDQFRRSANALVQPQAERGLRIMKDFGAQAKRAEVPLSIALGGTGIEAKRVFEFASGIPFFTGDVVDVADLPAAPTGATTAETFDTER